MASRICLGITFWFLWITNGSVKGQIKNLEFYAPNQAAPYVVAKVQEGDMQSEFELVRHLLSAPLKACGEGIWRFYPDKDFKFVYPAITGFQIGLDEKYRCFDLGDDGPKIAKMKSYRVLGPIDNNGIDINLNQQSITIYEGEYASERGFTFTTNTNYPVRNIPGNNFIVKSFVITGEHAYSVFPPDDTRFPVFQIFWNHDANTNTDIRNICYLLNNSDDFGRMYLQNRMAFVDQDGQGKSVYMGALEYYTRKYFDDTGIQCHFPWQIVGNSNITRFNEIKL